MIFSRINACMHAAMRGRGGGAEFVRLFGRVFGKYNDFVPSIFMFISTYNIDIFKALCSFYKFMLKWH